MKWESTILDKITKISKGKKHSETDDKSAFRYLQIEDLHGTGSNKYTTEKGIYCNESDLLIAWDGANAGKVGTGLNGMAGSTLARINITSTRVHSRFLYWFLSSKFEEIKSKRTGATIPHVNGSELRTMKVPLPPLPIQQQIADTLDKADALRRKDQELLDKYDELAQAVFYEMFGDPVRNEKKWQKEQLKSVCIQITDGTHFSPPIVSDGVPYITAKHVKNTGIYFYENPSFISKLDHEEIYSRCSPKKGDILYIKDGATTGVATINEFDFEFSMLSSLALIKPDSSKLNNQYLKHWLNHPLVKENYIREYMAGAAIKRFTLAKIKSFSIYVPPISLQNMFCKTIEKIERANKRTTESLKKSTELFNSALFRAFKS